MVNHVGIMVGEEAVGAYRFTVKVPRVFGIIATPFAPVTEEMFYFFTFDDMRRIGAQHESIVNHFHLRLHILLNFNPDGVGISAVTRCGGLNRIDIIGKRILRFYLSESIGGKRSLQGSRRSRVGYRHFGPTVRYTTGRTGSHRLDG